MKMDIQNRSLRKAFAAVAGGTAVTGPAAAQAITVGGVTATMAPWMLLAVPAVVGLWWLMRSIPKKPIKQIFPGISLLFNLETDEKTPKKAPWWQYIPITLASTALIAAMTSPAFESDLIGNDKGPILLVVDNSWAAGKNWAAHSDQIKQVIDKAEKSNRTILVLPTAMPANGGSLSVWGPLPASEAREALKELTPVPWPENIEGSVEALKAYKAAPADTTIWMSNGLSSAHTDKLVEELAKHGDLSVFDDDASRKPQVVREVIYDGNEFSVVIEKPASATNNSATVTLLDEAGKPLDQGQAQYKANENKTRISFKVPAEIGNQVSKITIDGESTAAASLLLDDRWRSRSVGLITGTQDIQPLLNPDDYVSKALEPYAKIKEGSVDKLLENPIAVLIMTDNVALTPAQISKVQDWVSAGGTLLRFAGPRLASKPDDKLLPLPIRQGERNLGGDLSGSKEGKIGDIPAKSPFNDIEIAKDIVVKQSVLPQPGADHDNNTWLRLQDGTPLVTAEKKDKGQIVLFHVTADPSWSNLALSGTFVDLLRKAITTSKGVQQDAEGPESALPPLKTMNGFGILSSAPSTTLPLNKEAAANCEVGPRNPPGIYGEQEGQRTAHNLNCALTELTPLTNLPAQATLKTYAVGQKEDDLRGYLFAAGLGFLLLDLGITLAQRRQRKPRISGNLSVRGKETPSP